MKNSIGSRRCFGFPFSLGLLLLSLAAAPQVQAQPWARGVAEGKVIPQLVSPEELPAGGTFWSVQRANLPPWPTYPPFLREWDAPVYLVDAKRGVYAVDDTQVDYEAIAQQRAEEKVLRQVAFQAGLLNAEEYWALEGGEPQAAREDYPTNALYLEITGVVNGQAQLVVHGTVEGEIYELLSKESLTNGAWAGEQPLVRGAAGQDWTATTVAVGARTNLFLWARSYVDSDGDGFPDWWTEQYFGPLGVDPYADPDGDGWSNWQEYQNGTNPHQFNTPAAPKGFAVGTDASGAHAQVAWLPAPGPVTGYTIQRGSDNAMLAVGSSSSSYTDAQNLPSGWYYDASVPRYRLRAEYAGGSGDWSGWQSVAELHSPVAQMLSGAAGHGLLLVTEIPATAAAVRVGHVRYDLAAATYYLTNILDLPVGQFTNGVAVLPATYAQNPTGYLSWAARFILTNAAAGALRDQWYETAELKPFWDARAQLKDNLRFLLRAASLDDYETPFVFGVRKPTASGSWLGEAYRGQPADYVHSSYYDFWEYRDELGRPHISQPVAEELPFADSDLYQHFVYSAANTDSDGKLLTGIEWHPRRMTLYLTNAYQFVPPPVGHTLPSVLNTNAARWLVDSVPYNYYQPRIRPVFSWEDEDSLFGVRYTYIEPDDLLHTMTSGARNWYGLPYESYLFTWEEGATDILTPAHPVVTPWYGGYYYLNVAQPAFQVADYYFVRVVDDYQFTAPPLPGYSYFDPTNTTPALFLTAVGARDFRLAGYAKLAVTNAYPGVYGYLGQYFDRAFTTTNGVATTNEAGWVSPYGLFIPTEPGRLALVTLPDLDTGERGTAIVHVVSLNVDANHDGVMDRSFLGPDQTSAAKPFTFWINNDRDMIKDIDDWGQDVPSLQSYLYDYRFLNINSVRDLEDYARLWICGIPALAADAGYQVTLSWNVSSGSPAINLVRAVETEGGTGYLTETNTAWAQIDVTTPAGPGWKLGPISAGQPFLLPGSYFTNSGDKYFLFEGAGIGSGELVLTIAQGTNVLAQSSVFMDLRDVKDLYERVVITNSYVGAIANWAGGIQVIESSKVESGRDTNIIIFVHGINNTVPDWLISSDTMFKRLYWSGYQGKVATVNWPCKFLPPRTHPFDFNLSEFYAYLAATGFKNYLTNLQARFPADRLHVLAHSQGNAVASEAIRQGAPFDTYILTQGALPANCFDTTVTNLQKLVDAEATAPTPDLSPMGYRGIYTNLTGQFINFYNPIDYALATGTELYGILRVNWEENERVTKPDGLPGARNYTSDGTNGYSLLGSPPRLVTDSRESRGMVARARSKAVGAQAGVAGVIDDSVDLETMFDFGRTRDEHSAQFTRPIQTVLPYYIRILNSITP